MPGGSSTWLETVVPSQAVTTSGNSAALQAPYGVSDMVLAANVTAYTSGTITFEVQWSNDGINFFSADQGTAGGTGTAAVKDTFASLTAVATLFKQVPARAPYYRITWSAASFTFNIQASAAAPLASGLGSPEGFLEGPSSQVGVVTSAGGAPVVGAIGSTTLSAVYAQATPATMSAITAVPTVPSEQGPVPVKRLGLKLIVTANTWTIGAVFTVVWSMTGVAGSTWQADPTDTFAGATAAFTSFKLLEVKAPFYAVTITAGTPGSATFTADHTVCQL